MTDPTFGIYWHQFDWPSFSTLLTGLLAVGAAYYVGKRQTKIAEDQKAIVSRQVDLEQLALRHDLFERRYDVYAAARNYLEELEFGIGQPNSDARVAFIKAIHESRFLFDSKVQTGLREIFDLSSNLNQKLQFSAAKERAGQTPTDEENDNILELRETLSNRLGFLAELFGESMRLYEPSAGR